MNNKINIEIEIDNNNELTATVTNGEFKKIYVDTVKHKARFEIANGITLNVDRVVNTIELLTLSNKPKLNLTDEQRTVLEGLYLLGYKYIARDKDNALFAYDRPPCRDKGSKGFWNGQYFMIDLNHINSTIHVLDNLCSWEDEKPTSIEWLLGKKDNNE